MRTHTDSVAALNGLASWSEAKRRQIEKLRQWEKRYVDGPMEEGTKGENFCTR